MVSIFLLDFRFPGFRAGTDCGEAEARFRRRAIRIGLPFSLVRLLPSAEMSKKKKRQKFTLEKKYTHVSRDRENKLSRDTYIRTPIRIYGFIYAVQIRVHAYV
jgi:hypothetical protein